MKYRSEIDGLRAIAVLSVMVFHIAPNFLVGGYLGVDIFFVISGFLITSIILEKALKNEFSFIEFYQRRIKRIMPALIFMMAFFIPVSWLLLMPNELQRFGRTLIASFFSFSNVIFWRESGGGYFAPNSELKPLLHTWSLGVEEQFYLIFPIVLILLLRLFRKHIFVIGLLSLIASFALSNYLSVYHAKFSFFMIFSRFWELLVGGLVAYVLLTRQDKTRQDKTRQDKTRQANTKLSFFSTLGFILIILSLIFLDDTLLHPSFYTLIPTVGVCLIILFNDENSIENKILQNRIIVFIGLLSYSLYLWHYPLLVFYKHYALFKHDMFGKIIVICLTFPFAYLSWKFIEQPFRHGKWTVTKRWTFFLTSLAVLNYGFYTYVYQGFSNRLSTQAQKILTFKNDKNPRRGECGYYAGKDKQNKSLDKACILGNKNNVIGALIGDSHAEALSFSLGKNLAKENMAVMNFWYSGCSPIMEIKRIANKEHQCARHNNRVISYLQDNPKLDIVILEGRYSAYFQGKEFNNNDGGIEPKGDFRSVNIEDFENPNLSEQQRKNNVKEKMVKTINHYLTMGKKIVLVYPIPEVGWNAPNEGAKRNFQPFMKNKNQNVSTSYQVFKERNKEVIEILDSIGEHKNLRRVYPHKVLCDTFIKNRCVAVLNGKSFYYDDDHLSIYGSEFITPKIIEAIKSFDKNKQKE